MTDNLPSTEPPESSLAEPPPIIFAGFWLRFFALLMDGSLLLIMLQVFALLLNNAGSDLGALQDSAKLFLTGGSRFVNYAELPEAPDAAALWCIFVIAGIIYYAAFESLLHGSTPAKLLLGIQVVETNGEAPPAGRLLYRSALKGLTAASCGFGFAICGFTANKQALHDFLGRCYVVRIRNWRLQHAATGIVCAISSALVAQLLVTASAVEELPTVQTAPQAIVQTKPKASPAKTAKPAGAVDFGYLKHGKVNLKIRDVIARVAPPELVDASAPAPAKLQRLEFYLFSRSLSAEEKNLLHHQPAVENVKSSVAPGDLLGVIFFDIEPHAVNCDQRMVQWAGASIRQEAAEKLHLPIESVERFETEPDYHRLDCDGLEEGAPVDLLLLQELKLPQNGGKFKWRVAVKDTVSHFRTLGTFKFDYSQTVVPLWHAKSGLLELGVFASPPSEEVLSAIAQSQSFSSAAPEALILVPLPPNRAAVSRDLARGGYELKLLPAASRRLPQSPERVNLRIKELPATLLGKLTKNGHLIGRFEGKKLHRIKEGLYVVAWNISFNSSNIIIAE